ncbi:hypothetical protein TNCV_1868101 [Trichonephila clavipes]|nr:hypothetical protein TNCV_1868101 [Trichonephila clavipes]
MTRKDVTRHDKTAVGFSLESRFLTACQPGVKVSGDVLFDSRTSMVVTTPRSGALTYFHAHLGHTFHLAYVQVRLGSDEKVSPIFSRSRQSNSPNRMRLLSIPLENIRHLYRTATARSDVVQSGRPIFDDFFQQLWPYIGNNTANVVFQMVKRLWLIRIDQ